MHNKADMNSSADRNLRILVIDDDPGMSRTIVRYFADQNINAIAAPGRQAANRLLAQSEPSLVILDMNRGHENGLDLLREIRSRSDVPLILTAAHGKDEADRVIGLELGADDYLVMPFGLRELLARARAVLRRQQFGRLVQQRERGTKIYRFGQWRLDCGLRRLINPDGDLVPITKNEYSLLLAFLETPGRPLSREQLLQATRVHEDVFDRTIDVQVLRLRRKLESDRRAPRVIRTERGVGYRFALSVDVLGPNYTSGPLWDDRNKGHDVPIWGPASPLSQSRRTDMDWTRDRSELKTEFESVLS
jgi:two-component system OmpR family response regulator